MIFTTVYKFCIVATPSDTLFDSKGGFSGTIKLSNEDIAEIEGLRDVAMATNFGTALAANGL